MIAITVDTENVLGSLLYVVATRVFGSRPIRLFNNNPDQSVIAELTSRVEAGAIRPFVAKVWSLDEVIDFHRALEAGGIRGKQVVRII